MFSLVVPLRPAAQERARKGREGKGLNRVYVHSRRFGRSNDEYERSKGVLDIQCCVDVVTYESKRARQGVVLVGWPLPF